MAHMLKITEKAKNGNGMKKPAETVRFCRF
jgi:hypothetical protein